MRGWIEKSSSLKTRLFSIMNSLRMSECLIIIPLFSSCIYIDRYNIFSLFLSFHLFSYNGTKTLTQLPTPSLFLDAPFGSCVTSNDNKHGKNRRPSNLTQPWNVSRDKIKKRKTNSEGHSIERFELLSQQKIDDSVLVKFAYERGLRFIKSDARTWWFGKNEKRETR